MSSKFLNYMESQVESAKQPLQQPTRQYHRLYKAILCALLILGFLTYRFAFPQPDVACISDVYHDATLDNNRDLVQDRASSAYEGNSNGLTVAGQGFIGTGQVIMDSWIAILGILWLVKVRNVRAFGAIACFFLTRSVIFLNIQRFPYPDNLAWRSPGFFAFTVPYDHTRDFFYSGHTGILTLIFLQMVLLRLKVASVMSFLCLIYMMNMLLITRVHYVVDIIGGLVFATWYHRQGTRFVVQIDKLLSLPYFIGNWIYVNKCNRCEEEQLQSRASGSQGGDRPASNVNLNKDGNNQIKMSEMIDVKVQKDRGLLKT